jgi:hypothetical protein
MGTQTSTVKKTPQEPFFSTKDPFGEDDCPFKAEPVVWRNNISDQAKLPLTARCERTRELANPVKAGTLLRSITQ